MSDVIDRLKSAVGKTVEEDAKNAATRLAGKQFQKMTREPLVAFLAGQLGPNDPAVRAKVAAFLETDLGGALLAELLSLGLGLIPDGVSGDLPKVLSRELRVQAMADVGGVVADLLTDPLRKVISDMIKDVAPEAPKALPAESISLVRAPSTSVFTSGEVTVQANAVGFSTNR